MNGRLMASMLLLLAGVAAGQVAERGALRSDDSPERARIGVEREAVRLRTEQAERDCYQQFAVNDCLLAARARRRADLAELRRQELTLDDAKRRQRAAEQLLRSDDKAANRP